MKSSNDIFSSNWQILSVSLPSFQKHGGAQHYDLYERDAGRLLALLSLFPQLAGNTKRREQSLECKRSLVETSWVFKISFSVGKNQTLHSSKIKNCSHPSKNHVMLIVF